MLRSVLGDIEPVHNASATQNVTLEKGKTYTVSGYIKTSSISGSFGAYIRALYYNASGAETWEDSPVLVGTNDWGRYSVTFTVPVDAASTNGQIYLLLKGSTGTVWFDAVQLEEGNVVNRYNLVENADFTNYSGNAPTFWTRNGLSTSDTIDISADGSHPLNMGNARFKIVGDCKPATVKAVSQTINVSGNANDSFVLGGWAKGTSVSLTRDSNKIFGLTAVIKYTDTTSETYVLSFNEDSNIWQYACGAIVANKAYSSITIGANYSGEANTAYFDGIQLFREEFGESYSYDANGNLKSAKDLDNKNSQYTYANNDLTKYKTPDSREYNYTYDTKHNLMTAVSPSGLTYSYQYDPFGNQKESKLGNATDFIRSTTTYIENGNYVDTTTDPFGKVVDYNFDPYTGMLSKITEPNGKEIVNSYDDLFRQTDASMTDGGKTVSNRHGYTGDNLTSVSHNSPNDGSVDYTLSYNELGQKDEIKVGVQRLAKYVYQDRTSRLDSLIHGNGQEIDNLYDAFDRLKQVSQDGNALYSYEYDNSGNVGYQKDWVNNKQYWYEYDSLLRLGKVTTKDAGGTINWSKYSFDNRDNLVSFAENIASVNYPTTYPYDSDDRLKTSSFGTSSIDYSYDATMGRLTNYAYKVNGTAIFNSSFAYAPGDGVTSTASERISTITNGSQILTYTYNDMGYTTSVSNGSDSSQYRYDGIGELIRENYHWDGISYSMLYNYDEGGNLTSKVKYAYVADDGAVGTPLETINYEYGDTNWKDKLTSYNGNSITYDEIGNPKNDGKWTYSWTQGRQLQQMTDGTTTINYKYNDSGIRTEKNVNGVLTQYVLDGDKVTWEKTGINEPIYYLYDAKGKLWGLKYKGNVYFYIRNAQNDIINIVDSSGSVMVTYSYDAWGKLLKISGTMGDTLGKDNSYRYRGYRFDNETGLYYLQSRYYNPEWNRYINSDNFASTGYGLLSNNMFLYCLNNPNVFSDDSGNRPMIGDDPMHETKEERDQSFQAMNEAIKITQANRAKEEDYYVFVSTVAGEAGGKCSNRERKAVAHAIINRIGSGDWKNLKTAKDVCSKPHAFDSYQNKNYMECYNYLKFGTGNPANFEHFDQLAATVLPVYNGEEADFTQGAVFFHSGKAPDSWYENYKEVKIDGVDPKHFYFFTFK